MSKQQDMQLSSFQDSWVIMYAYVARELYYKGGIEGDAALREAVRRYARNRGRNNRERLLAANIKINLDTLFHEGRDRPGECRFEGPVLRAQEDERILHTHICSYADVWKEYDAKWLGRIYCEEFHLAAYQEFSFNSAKINLSRSLTQDGDDRCWFTHTMRPENMTAEERKLCFAEYDPGYKKPSTPMAKPDPRGGFNMMWVSMVGFFVQCAQEYLGETGVSLVAEGLRKYAIEQAKVFIRKANSLEREPDREFVAEFLVLNMDIDAETLWDKYDLCGAKEIVRSCFYKIMFKELGI